ncbi:unnamed protein product [marine sediment metagenome]|jgi:hypothetical protein|uniref:HMG box domain-containing protein n=1 Tax=marine sediment metagenome TaxID=412755 RepID=X0SVQ9_9ZZZZ
MQAIANEYKTLSREEKTRWEEEARKDKIRYIEEKTNHKGSWDLPKRRAKKHPLAPKRP